MLKWLIRGSIPVGVITLVLLIRLYQSWTSPEVVRRLLLERLQDRLSGAQVEVQNARLCLWGGITFENLSISHAGERVLHAPEGQISHDRESLARGRLVIRQFELDRPTLRVERRPDGTWNFTDLFQPSSVDDSAPLPVVIVRDGTLIVSQAVQQAGTVSELVLQDVSFTLVPDGNELVFEGSSRTDLFGPVELRGRWDGYTDAIHASLDLSDLSLGPKLLTSLGTYLPIDTGAITKFAGMANIHVELAYRPDESNPLHYHAIARLREGRFSHPQVPVELDQIDVDVECRDGQLTVRHARARAGDCDVLMKCRMSLLGPFDVSSPEDLLKRCDYAQLSVHRFHVDKSTFEHVPDEFQFINRMFAPEGPVSVVYERERFREGARTRISIRPDKLRGVYEEFPLPIQNVQGTIDATLEENKPIVLDVNLTAIVNSASVTIRGRIIGEPPTAGVRFRITGTGLPLDEDVIATLPEPYPDFVRQMNAEAHGDFVVDIWQSRDTPLLYKRFEVAIHDGKARYELFPVKLNNVNGVIISTPAATDVRKMGGNGDAVSGKGTIELRDFRAELGSGRLLLNGKKGPSSRGSTLNLDVDIRQLALDRELRNAVDAVGMCQIWSAFAPEGQMNVVAQLKIHDQAENNDHRSTATTPADVPEKDSSVDLARTMEVSLAVSGATVTPQFFPCRFEDFSGRVHYKDGRFSLDDCRARHRNTVWKLSHADVVPRDDGGFWADLRELNAWPLAVDNDFLRALPSGLRQALEHLQLDGRLRLGVRRLVVDDPEPWPQTCGTPTLARNPNTVELPTTVYWDAILDLFDAKLSMGVDFERVTGRLGCRGRYDGDRFGAVVGNLQFSRAWTHGVPLTDGLVHLVIDPREPDILQVPRIHARLLNGDLGGEARARIDRETPLYELKLNALNVQLGQLSRYLKLPPEALLEGSATSQLFLTNWPEKPGAGPLMRGNGVIDVPEGRMLNLPMMLDLLKVLNLRKPDRTAFEEAHAVFDIRGERMNVTRLDLLGNAISLGGQGGLNLDGSDVRFEFYTVWSRVIQDWLADPVGDLTAAMSKELFRIEVNGSVPDGLKYGKVAVPVMTEPFQRVMEGMGRPRE